MTETIKMLASLATMNTLQDSGKYKSQYQLLAEFVRYIVSAESLFEFDVPEMQSLMEKHFGFSVPKAVLKTAIKGMSEITCTKLDCRVSDHVVPADLFTMSNKDSSGKEEEVLASLTSYVQQHVGESADRKQIESALYSFLLGERGVESENEYYELVAQFVLKNEGNGRVREWLDSVRQGSVLYLGITYDVREIGSLSRPLNLYLSTEILFDIAGYNGELYQRMSLEFLALVKKANAKQKLVSMYFFLDTQNDVDAFFYAAGCILKRQQPVFHFKAAMKAILNGCSTVSDVTNRNSDFYYSLKTKHGIILDPNDSYYGEEFYEHNLEEPYDDSDDSERKKAIALRSVDHILKLRAKETCTARNELESGYLVVSDNRNTLSISANQAKSFNRHCSEFAVSLERITNLLWYKVSYGFGASAEFPSSVQAVLKARTVLSASVRSKADIRYGKLKEQIKNGELSNEQLQERIRFIVSKPQLPEDFTPENVEAEVDFSEERFEKETAKLRQLELENAELREIKQIQDLDLGNAHELLKRKDEEIKSLESRLAEGQGEAREVKKDSKLLNCARKAMGPFWSSQLGTFAKAIVFIILAVCAVELCFRLLEWLGFHPAEILEKLVDVIAAIIAVVLSKQGKEDKSK